MVRLTKEGEDWFREQRKYREESLFDKNSRIYSVIREELTTLLFYMDLHLNPFLSEELNDEGLDKMKRAILKIANENYKEEGEIIDATPEPTVNLSCFIEKNME